MRNILCSLIWNHYVAVFLACMRAGCTLWSAHCCCSVTQSCLTLRNPIDCRMPGLPVPHQLPELAQIYVHRVGDAIQPSHPLSSLSLLAFNLPASESFLRCQLFESSAQSFGASASVLPMNIQGCFPLGVTGLISLLSKGLSSLLQHHSSKASVLWCSAYYFILNYIQIFLNHTKYLMMNFPTVFL